jgi:DNA polymerase-3 subunit chi
MLADATPYTRVAYVFDGRDQDAVARAREAWQTAKAQGLAVSYWQQGADGRWEQKA